MDKREFERLTLANSVGRDDDFVVGANWAYKLLDAEIKAVCSRLMDQCEYLKTRIEQLEASHHQYIEMIGRPKV